MIFPPDIQSMLLHPNNSSSLKNYYLLDSRGDSGTFQVKSIVGTRDVRKNKSFREGGSMELTKRQEQLHFLLLFYSAGFCLYCSFRNRRVDSMQSGQRKCSNWPVKKSIGLDGRTINNHSCLHLLPQEITNLFGRTICLFCPHPPEKEKQA